MEFKSTKQVYNMRRDNNSRKADGGISTHSVQLNTVYSISKHEKKKKIGDNYIRVNPQTSGALQLV